MSVPLGKCHAVIFGVLPSLPQPGIPESCVPSATARIHTLMTDMLDVIHVCLSPSVSATLGSRLAMSARVLCHVDASDIIIYVSQNTQTVPGHGKATPVGIPCVRPQSDMRCYRLGLCDLESGS